MTFKKQSENVGIKRLFKRHFKIMAQLFSRISKNRNEIQAELLRYQWKLPSVDKSVLKTMSCLYKKKMIGNCSK